jgi:hypothetical protein
MLNVFSLRRDGPGGYGGLGKIDGSSVILSILPRSILSILLRLRRHPSFVADQPVSRWFERRGSTASHAEQPRDPLQRQGYWASNRLGESVTAGISLRHATRGAAL